MGRREWQWLALPAAALLTALSACGGGARWTQDSAGGTQPAQVETACKDSGWCTLPLDGPVEATATGGAVSPPGPSGGPSGGEPVSQKSSALTSSVLTVDSRTNRELAETNASAYENASGQWEMVAGTNTDLNTLNVAEDTDHFDYGCARDSYNTWCHYTLSSSLGLFGPDDTLTYRAGPTHYLYMLKMRSDTAGFRMMRTTDPCPSSCATPAWSICNISSSGIDFPTVRWRPGDDTVYFTFVKGTNRELYVGRMNEPWCSTWSYWADADATGVGGARATFDESGKLHILFTTAGGIRHTVFDPGSGFGSVTPVAAYLPPTNNVGSNAGACVYDSPPYGQCNNRPTYYGLGTTDCLRYAPDIGIDSDPWTGTLIATTTAHGSGNCAEKQEQRIYRSIDGGASWNWILVTGCNTSIFVDVRDASMPGFYDTNHQGWWQVRSSYNSGTSGLAEVMWRSTDDGQTWAGTYITGTRAVGGPIHDDCYWGDYNGLATDPANNSFFYSFGNGTYPNNTPADWVIRGKAQDE